MIRKSVDRIYLKSVIDREFIYLKVNDNSFDGYISLFKINKVTDSWVINYGKKDICVINNGYKLLQYVPLGENYTLTVFCDEENKIIQWYFDITYGNGIDDDGIPYYDDLYLDIVIFPPFEVHLVDKDELEEAVDKKKISNEQYNLACQVADRLMNDILSNRMKLMNRYEIDLMNMLELLERR